MSRPFVSYVPPEHAVNWSEDLEELHEESSRTHFIDVWTRRAMLARVGRLPEGPTVIDIGCSTGHLLQDLRCAIPDASLVGVDLVAGGVRQGHDNGAAGGLRPDAAGGAPAAGGRAGAAERGQPV